MKTQLTAFVRVSSIAQQNSVMQAQNAADNHAELSPPLFQLARTSNPENAIIGMATMERS
jgi:hypothetical protein